MSNLLTFIYPPSMNRSTDINLLPNSMCTFATTVTAAIDI